VHNLSPGLVLTDLLLKDSNVVARRFFNALAEEAPTVAAALVPRIRSVQVRSFSSPPPPGPAPPSTLSASGVARGSCMAHHVWDGQWLSLGASFLGWMRAPAWCITFWVARGSPLAHHV
jgi:hypothetical protein